MISCVISGKKKLGYLHNLNTNQTKTHKQTSFTLVLKHEKEIQTMIVEFGSKYGKTNKTLYAGLDH